MDWIDLVGVHLTDWVGVDGRRWIGLDGRRWSGVESYYSESSYYSDCHIMQSISIILIIPSTPLSLSPSVISYSGWPATA
jgi:hypothetical protein